jgi:hypothetical protein
MGASTEARKAASQDAASRTGTVTVSVAAAVASDPVIAMRYSIWRTLLVGRGRNADHSPPRSVIRTEYHPPVASARNCRSARAAFSLARPATRA